MTRFLRAITLLPIWIGGLALVLVGAAMIIGDLNQEEQALRLANLRKEHPRPEPAPRTSFAFTTCDACKRGEDDEHAKYLLRWLPSGWSQEIKEELRPLGAYDLNSLSQVYTRALVREGRLDEAVEFPLTIIEVLLDRKSADTYAMYTVPDVLRVLVGVLHEHADAYRIGRVESRLAEIRGWVPSLDDRLDQTLERSLQSALFEKITVPTCREMGHWYRTLPALWRGRFTSEGALAESYLLRRQERRDIGHVDVSSWWKEQERVLPIIEDYQCRCSDFSLAYPTGFASTIWAVGCLETNLRLFEGFLDGCRGREETGAYPGSLEAGVDPLSGKPLLYRSEGDHVELVAVGFDGREDGGGSIDQGTWVGDLRLSTRGVDPRARPVVPLALNAPVRVRPGSQHVRWIIVGGALFLFFTYCLDVARQLRNKSRGVKWGAWISVALFAAAFHGAGLLTFWGTMLYPHLWILALSKAALPITVGLLLVGVLSESAWKERRPALAWVRTLWGGAPAFCMAAALAWPATLQAPSATGEEFAKRYHSNITGRDANFVYYWESGGLSCSQFLAPRRVAVDDFFSAVRSKLARQTKRHLEGEWQGRTHDLHAALALDLPLGTPYEEMQEVWKERGGRLELNDRQAALSLRIHHLWDVCTNKASPKPLVQSDHFIW